MGPTGTAALTSFSPAPRPGPRMRPTGRSGGRLARYNSRVSRRQFSPSVIGLAEEPLGEVNPLLHLGELISEPCKFVVQRIQLLLVRWIAGVSRNAPCDGFAEPRPGQQQQSSDADDYEWDRHDEHFGNALKDLEVHAPLDEAGASKVSSRNGDLSLSPGERCLTRKCSRQTEAGRSSAKGRASQRR